MKQGTAKLAEVYCFIHEALRPVGKARRQIAAVPPSNSRPANPNHNTNSNPKPNLTLTKTLKLNPNRLSYWECCRNMVRKKKICSQDIVSMSTAYISHADMFISKVRVAVCSPPKMPVHYRGCISECDHHPYGGHDPTLAVCVV